ncbi:MAG TPA: Mrp/NBP35 family ATP-binding protein [Gemmatimonadaceae bacterium]|nr:Mrp/NBP35 family ATP-binding protein [Gemmatimonadaceae bacterium]
MTEPLTARIDAALRQVTNPRTGLDIVSSEMVRDIAVTVEGRVRFTMLLSAVDPASLVRESRQAVERLEGVRDVRVDVKDPSQLSSAAATGEGGRARAAGGEAPAAGRTLPVMGQEPQSRQARMPPAPTPVAYPSLGRIIAVSSGKGGVGKSTVATNLAVALARSGARVGIMDADIYGPNIPRMLGVSSPPPVEGDRIIPLEAHGVKVMSLGFLVERDQPAIWRGPIVMKIIVQFLRDVAWGQLDYLFVDLPPGTGDAQLSLVQATHVHGALIVTTPQPVATGDALRGARMFQRVGVPVLGIIENMSYFACPHCGKPTPLFGSGGGRELADELGLPLLAEIPLWPQLRVGGDEGMPIVVAEPESAAGRALIALASRVADAVGAVVPA